MAHWMTVPAAVVMSMSFVAITFAQDAVEPGPPAEVITVVEDVEYISGPTLEYLDEPEMLLKLLDQEQADLLKKIKNMETNLKGFRAAYEQREALRDKIKKGELPNAANELLQPVEFVKHEQIVVHEPDKLREASYIVSLEYENVSWKTILDGIQKDGIFVEAAEYPPGTVSFTGFRKLTKDEALSIIKLKLEAAGYAIWKTANGLRLVTSLEPDHPLLGSWQIQTWMANGQVDENPGLRAMIVSPQTLAFVQSNDELLPFEFRAEGQDIYWLYTIDESDPILSQGSYQVQGDQATVLLAHPEGDTVLLIKLRRIK